jgi:hypothetical protein
MRLGEPPAATRPTELRDVVAVTGARGSCYFFSTNVRAIFADSDEPARSRRRTVSAVTAAADVLPLLMTGLAPPDRFVSLGTYLPSVWWMLTLA